MSRWRPRVIYTGSRVLSPGEPPSSISAQIATYIPGEAITVYQGVAGLVTAAAATEQAKLLTWTAIACLIFTFLWNLLGARDPAKKEPPAWSQSVTSTLAFVVWLFALDSPVVHNLVANWNQLQGSVVLLISTGLVMPLIGRALNYFFKD